MLAILRLPATVRRLALASMIGNIVIVVTGGAVRLTGSGLGCPTWPNCTEESLTTTPEMGINGAIEFGNRLLTYPLGLIAVAALLAAYLQRDRLPAALLPAAVAFVGIPVQGVVGGMTVLTGLNPWIVGTHFLVSTGIIAATYEFWRRTRDLPPAERVPGPLRTLAWLTAATAAATIVLGVLVTGSGPHSGDIETGRNGLDPEALTQFHADAIFLLSGLTVALWLALRAVDAPRAARAAGVLLVVLLAQGVVGFVQYFTGLPIVLVGMHMLGACLVWVAALHARGLAGGPPATSGPDHTHVDGAGGGDGDGGDGDGRSAGDRARAGRGRPEPRQGAQLPAALELPVRTVSGGRH